MLNAQNILVAYHLCVRIPALPLSYLEKNLYLPLPQFPQLKRRTNNPPPGAIVKMG